MVLINITYTCIRYWKMAFVSPATAVVTRRHIPAVQWLEPLPRLLLGIFRRAHASVVLSHNRTPGETARRRTACYIIRMYIYIDMRSDSSFCSVSAHAHTCTRVYVCVWIINITPTPSGPSRDRRPNTPQTSTSTERTAAYSRVNIVDLPSAQRRSLATRSVETPLTREEFF